MTISRRGALLGESAAVAVAGVAGSDSVLFQDWDAPWIESVIRDLERMGGP